MPRIRPYRSSDRDTVAAMRAALWLDGDAAHHAAELDGIVDGAWSGTFPYEVLVAETDDGELLGFADVTMRSYAEGCEAGKPAGYLEGWFVQESHRRKGIGAALMRAAEQWARDHGCTEMASDTWLDNELSQKAHERLGYEEADRCVHYRKTL